MLRIMKYILNSVILIIHNNILIKKIIKKILLKAFEPPNLKNSQVFGYFCSENENNIPLIIGLRDWINPSWRNMLRPKKERKIPTKRETKDIIERSEESVNIILNYLKLTDSFDIKGKRVLEIGCYDGSRTYALAKMGAREVVGADISKYYENQNINKDVKNIDRRNIVSSNLSNLRKNILNFYLNESDSKFIKHSKIKFIEDDITKSNLLSSYFDLIISWEVLEHVLSPFDMFKQMNRILKPNGISFHEYNSFFSFTGGHSLCSLDFEWGHIRLNEDEFIKYLMEIRKSEYELAYRFYKKNLNRMTIDDLIEYSKKSKLKLLAMIPWYEKKYLKILSHKIVLQIQLNYPKANITDFISPIIWVLQKKEP